jgi:hypothetical protein
MFQRILAREYSGVPGVSESTSIREYQRVLGSQNRYLEVPESTTNSDRISVSLYRSVHAKEIHPTIYVNIAIEKV